ncbi:helix-turn-helix transcriptional regulator [Marinobacteraceae bacterium S3BR75-40.1]
MAQTAAIVDALKQCLRENGVTYQQVAEELDLSEASVKRLFSQRQFSLKRLDQICALLGIEITDLTKRITHEPRIDQLDTAQERALVEDARLLLVAVCALNHWTFEQIIETYTLTEPEVISKLAQLDRMGLIELLPNNRIKTLISHDFHWQRNGPIQSFFESQVQGDFLEARFNRPGEVRVFLNGMFSTQSNEAIQQKIKRLALDFRHCHQEDLNLPLEQRFGVSMLVAMRPWELEVFDNLRKSGRDKPYPGHGKAG